MVKKKSQSDFLSFLPRDQFTHNLPVNWLEPKLFSTKTVRKGYLDYL